jgi:hypothetical protein
VPAIFGIRREIMRNPEQRLAIGEERIRPLVGDLRAGS